MKMQTGKAISIPSILKVGNGTLNKIGEYLKSEELTSVVIFMGNGLIDMFGDAIMKSLSDADITVLEYSELDTVEIDDIITLAFDIPNKAKAVVSVGGGKVIDAGKYAAFLRNLPFISVPTSSSSDGFSSASASLLVHGKRTSVPAKLAHGIIVDTQVIRTAPEKFIYSGIGDMVSKITALYDWIFEEKHGAGVVNDFAVMVAKKAVNSFVRTPYESIKDELFLKELVDSLAMSGIANEIAGSSAPTSGSEHLISHALDKILEHPQLHGIQVGIATYIMSVVQNHRYVRVCTVLKRTGFFDYAATLGMRKQDFLDAVDRIIGGLEKKTKITTEAERRSIALHEAGHASISWLLEYANPLIKVTIVPRGRALGAAWYLPEERQITTREQMLDEMCATLGGRAAEEVFLGRISTGASNDLERVTKQAYAMVVYFGMSEKLPNLSYYDSTGQEYGFTKPYSEDTAKLIDEEVSKIVSEQYERAKKILKENADKHAQLAEVLISREVIFSEDVEHIFGKRPWVSRSEEILQDEESAKQEGEKAEKETQEKDLSTGNDNTHERENKTEEKPEKDSENT